MVVILIATLIKIKRKKKTTGIFEKTDRWNEETIKKKRNVSTTQQHNVLIKAVV